MEECAPSTRMGKQVQLRRRRKKKQSSIVSSRENSKMHLFFLIFSIVCCIHPSCGFQTPILNCALEKMRILHHPNRIVTSTRLNMNAENESNSSNNQNDGIDTDPMQDKSDGYDNDMKSYSGRFLEDNGLSLIVDDTGRVTAVPVSSLPEKDKINPDGTLVDTTLTTTGGVEEDLPNRISFKEIMKESRNDPDLTTQSKRKKSPDNGFNVVLTHCTADFDSLASAVGLAKLWSIPHPSIPNKDNDNDANGANDTESSENGSASSQFDSYDTQALPTFVVLPRGAHPSVQRFLALHKHLFPIKSLRSLPSDLTALNRLGLVDAQRRDRVGPAEHLLSYASRVTIVDHHIDGDSDIPEATDYIVDKVGSVSTLIVESLMSNKVRITEAEATLLALGIHADTGSLCFDSTTARDAKALAWLMEVGASQTAIAEHSQGSLSTEQQGVLTQALLNMNSTVVHGVTVSSVLLSAEGFINGLAAVTQDALELSGSDVLLLSVVYDPRRSSSKKRKLKPSESAKNLLPAKLFAQPIKNPENPLSSSYTPSLQSEIMKAGAWKGGEEAFKRRRWKAAFDKSDLDSSGYLDLQEIEAALFSSGVIGSKESAEKVMELLDTNGDGKIDFDEFLEFAAVAEQVQKEDEKKSGKRACTMIVIGRCKAGVNLKSINLNKLFQQFGGGGHAKAASATKRLGDEGEAGIILQNLVDEMIETSLLEQPTVGDFMTSPVLSAKPDMTEKQVEDLFIRYDVRALPVVDDNNDVIGLVTYKEVAAAKQRLWNKKQKYLKKEAQNKNNKNKGENKRGSENNKITEKRKLGSALKGWMKQHVRIVEASMTMAEVEQVLLENDVGCIPVVLDGSKHLVGMVTRTDLLRQHRYYPTLHYHNKGFSDSIAARKPVIELRKRLKQFDLDE